tara:strand:- start:6555 stop:7037 length:483 start_codon:yes stop_codon:yes gene_type:complete
MLNTTFWHKTNRNCRSMLAFVAMFMLLSSSIPLDRKAAAAEADQRTAFEHVFVTAFRSGDLRLADRLFVWDGVSPEARAAITLMIQRDLTNTLLETRWLTPADDEAATNQRGLQSNAAVVARFAALFLDERGRHYVSIHDIGVVDGTYFIALVAPRDIGA